MDDRETRDEREDQKTVRTRRLLLRHFRSPRAMTSTRREIHFFLNDKTASLSELNYSTSVGVNLEEEEEEKNMQICSLYI